MGAEVTEVVATGEVVEEEAMEEIAMRNQSTFRAPRVLQVLLARLVTKGIPELRVIPVPLELQVILVKMEHPDHQAKEGLQENQVTMGFLENKEYLEKEVLFIDYQAP